MSIMKSALIALACSALLVPAAASAKPGVRDFNHTYPYAAKLCKAVEKGKTPKRLQGSEDALKAACTTLHGSYDSARSTWVTSAKSLRAEAKADVQAARAACKTAHASGDKAACKAAKKTAFGQLKALRQQARTAGSTYHDAVVAARKAFWSTVKALPGGSSVTADDTTPAAPTVDIPATA